MQFRDLICGGVPDTPFPLPPEPTEPPTVYTPDEAPTPFDPGPQQEPVIPPEKLP